MYEKMKEVIDKYQLIIDQYNGDYDWWEWDKIDKAYSESKFLREHFRFTSNISKHYIKIINDGYKDYSKNEVKKTYTSEQLNKKFDNLNYEDI